MKMLSALNEALYQVTGFKFLGIEPIEGDWEVYFTWNPARVTLFLLCVWVALVSLFA